MFAEFSFSSGYFADVAPFLGTPPAPPPTGALWRVLYHDLQPYSAENPYEDAAVRPYPKGKKTLPKPPPQPGVVK